MNLILVTEDDFIAPGRVLLRDRRWHHLRNILAAEPGRQLKVGLMNGQIGTGIVASNGPRGIEIDVVFETDPPLPPGLALLLALPRPKVLRRILQSATALGAKKIVLVNSFRVEKSYWQSPFLQADALREQLVLGLEQAGDTRLPEILLRPRFKPFVEDELPGLSAGACCWLADPAANKTCPADNSGPAWVAIGPEGGFIPYEIDLLCQKGFRRVRLGQRVLRVETAVAAMLGRLIPASCRD